MAEEIKKLEPTKVWEFFYDLTQIPRPSGHEKEVQQYVVKFRHYVTLLKNLK
mgnify:CR=1 FL=1